MSDLVLKLPDKIDGIYDIQPPPTPGLSGLEISLVIIGIVVLMSFCIFIYRNSFYSNKNRYTRKIKRLLKSKELKKQDTRKTIYQLCHYLKIGLNIKQININTPLPADIANIDNNQERWLTFTRRLSDARYKNQADYEISAIFNEGLYWLKKWSK